MYGQTDGMDFRVGWCIEHLSRHIFTLFLIFFADSTPIRALCHPFMHLSEGMLMLFSSYKMTWRWSWSWTVVARLKAHLLATWKTTSGRDACTKGLIFLDRKPCTVFGYQVNNQPGQGYFCTLDGKATFWENSLLICNCDCLIDLPVLWLNRQSTISYLLG